MKRKPEAEEHCCRSLSILTIRSTLQMHWFLVVLNLRRSHLYISKVPYQWYFIPGKYHAGGKACRFTWDKIKQYHRTLKYSCHEYNSTIGWLFYGYGWKKSGVGKMSGNFFRVFSFTKYKIGKIISSFMKINLFFSSSVDI